MILAFYTLETLCLPMGDFSMLKDLPEMFRHCKATEDSDLNVFEFLIEHVSPIGELIEGTEHGPEEDGDKPHQAIQSINSGHSIVFVIPYFAFSIKKYYPIVVKQPALHNDTLFTSSYIFKIFHPPIVA